MNPKIWDDYVGTCTSNADSLASGTAKWADRIAYEDFQADEFGKEVVER